MILSAISNLELTFVQHADFCFRLLLSLFIGGLIGNERSRSFKEAGVRTHAIVCVTTALLMLVSKYGFIDMSINPDFFASKGVDASRIASQAVSGISFLCAGVIFKVGTSIRGLTTAAGIWLTGGIGLAIGAGMYVEVVFTMLLLYAFQRITSYFKFGKNAYEGNQMQFVVKNGMDFDTDLRAQVVLWKGAITDNSFKRNSDGTYTYDLTIRREKTITYAELSKFVEEQGDNIISVSNAPYHQHLH